METYWGSGDVASTHS